LKAQLPVVSEGDIFKTWSPPVTLRAKSETTYIEFRVCQWHRTLRSGLKRHYHNNINQRNGINKLTVVQLMKFTAFYAARHVTSLYSRQTSTAPRSGPNKFRPYLHFNIVLPSMSNFSKLLLSFVFSNENFLRYFLLSLLI
jgi:hypothetical protein